MNMPSPLLSATSRIIDITVPFSADLPVWPGDPAIEMRPLDRIASGATANVTQIVAPTHCGTHVDPPWHFIDDGPRLDEIPAERWIGPCLVVRVADDVAAINSAHLEMLRIPEGTERLLFKTSNSAKWRPGKLTFDTDYVALTPDGARWIVDHGIRLVGIDYLSIECWDDAANETHRTLLGNGVLAIEGLNLTDVEPGAYTLICLPLKIAGGDGAPARVVLITP